MKFVSGDRVEWIPAPDYKGTVERVTESLLGVWWDGKNGEVVVYAEHPVGKHRLIERDPFADQFEIDCD